MTNCKKILAFILISASIGASEDFRHCFDNYRGWRSPIRVEYQIKRIVCNFFIMNPQYQYFHHSDFRPQKEAVEDYHGHDDGGKSQHWYGKALDFHGVDYTGMSDCQKKMEFMQFAEDVDFWFRINGYGEGGKGEYPQRENGQEDDEDEPYNPFVHRDLEGLGKGERKNRSWARIDKKYVSFKKGREWLENEIDNCMKILEVSWKDG